MRAGHMHLLCGKMASGKSTLAAGLVLETAGVLLSEDELLAGLYPGEVLDLPSYIEKSARVKRVFKPHLVSLLQQELILILDFPANTSKLRAWLLTIAEQAQIEHTLHYLECSDSFFGGVVRQTESGPRYRFVWRTEYEKADALNIVTVQERDGAWFCCENRCML